ncbi:MAG: hypothetical protein JW953_14510 [Anaerolineae bacterium]|nr:hypothetical protein [Anaerolineae bacterium]
MSIRVVSNNTVYFLRLDLLGQGETAHVFPAYLEGQKPADAQWAVKLAKNQDHNLYLDREYDILCQLRDTMLSLPRGARAFPNVIPLPDAQLGNSSDGRRALVMQPLLHQSLLETFENLTDPLAREKLALTAAQQYTDLLQTLAQLNLSCQDRKLGDLWWVGSPETGHLVVTDWNVISDTFNPALDLRRFGLLWFELIIGPQMPPGFQPKREDFDQIQDKVSYGWWYMLGRALGSTIGPQFRRWQELADLLGQQANFYRQQPQELARQARNHLAKAQAHLDRTQADLAWIQFDLAQRLDSREPVTGLAQARLWAYDPVAQAAPDLIRKLASPQFSEVETQLQELKDKVQQPQELGDVNRLQLGFDLLNLAKDALIKTGDTTGLAEAAQEFAELQELLVEGILRPLLGKNGPTAQQNLSKLATLLPPECLAKLNPLENEAAFWTEYEAINQTLYVQPEQARQPLANCRSLRQAITHWPAAYEPTVEDLQRLQAILEANARSAVLAGTGRAPLPSADKTPAAGALKPGQTANFWPALAEDLVKNRWGDSIAKLLNRLEQESEKEKVKLALEPVLQQLAQNRQELAAGRPSPGRLAERVNLLEILLQLPPDFTLKPATIQQVRQELAEVRQLEQQIKQDQQELFTNPGPALDRALAGGYELFDDISLSAATLKALRQVGRWDRAKLNQEFDHLEKQADRLLIMSQILEERQQTLAQVLDFYKPLLESPSSESTIAFLTNTLRLYLATAQAQRQAGESAAKSLDKVGALLKQTTPFLSPDEQAVYQNLYEHLRELDGSQLDLNSLTAPVPEAQLEAWFKAYRFEDCYEKLSGLADESRRQKWRARLRDATQLRKIVRQGEPKPTPKYLRKKQNIQLCADTLATLSRCAQNSEPMAYALYQDEIQDLYAQTWHKLAQLDQKSAARFEPNLQAID